MSKLDDMLCRDGPCFRRIIHVEVIHLECKLKKILKPGDITRISDKTGIHRNSISRYVNNERLPRIHHAYKIAAALNKTVYEIWPPD